MVWKAKSLITPIPTLSSPGSSYTIKSPVFHSEEVVRNLQFLEEVPVSSHSVFHEPNLEEKYFELVSFSFPKFQEVSTLHFGTSQ